MITPEEYKALVSQEPKNKYNSKITVLDGIKFHSKREAQYYQRLKQLKTAGDIEFFLRQVPFDISGAKYLLDFLIFHPGGRIQAVDCKGIDTTVSKLKRKQVETLYHITIELA